MMKKRIVLGICILIVAIAGGYFILKHRAEKATRVQVESVVFRIPGVRAIDYETVDTGWKSPKVRMGSVKVFLVDPEEEIRIDEILVHDFDPAHEFPDRLDVEIRGVHLQADQPRLVKLQPYLTAADYQELVLNLRCAYRYDRDRHLLTIEKLQIHAASAGRLDFTTQLNNIDLPRLIRNLNDKVYLITALPGVSVATAELFYTDDSLARRVLKTGAAPTGQPPPELARHLASALEQRMGETNRPSTREALAGLNSFIVDPDRLHVTAAPPAPVSLLRFLWIRQLSDVIELLHIRVGR